MPMKFTQRRAEDVPTGKPGRGLNPDFLVVKSEMARLTPGLVLEIQTSTDNTVRGTKMLVTKAARELGVSWRHWNVGSTVFARPVEEAKRRGRPRKA